MAALTQDRNTPFQDATCVALPVKAGAVIYAGALVCVDATGHAVPGATAVDLIYVGRAEEMVSAAGLADGEIAVPVRRGVAFRWANDGSITQANLFQPAFIVDDQTLAATDGTATRSAAGKIIAIEPAGVWIE